MKQSTYIEKVRPVDQGKVAKWQKLRPSIGTFAWIAEQTFRSRPVIHNAINYGLATESTEENIDKLFGL